MTLQQLYYLLAVSKQRPFLQPPKDWAFPSQA